MFYLSLLGVSRALRCTRGTPQLAARAAAPDPKSGCCADPQAGRLLARRPAVMLDAGLRVPLLPIDDPLLVVEQSAGRAPSGAGAWRQAFVSMGGCCR